MDTHERQIGMLQPGAGHVPGHCLSVIYVARYKFLYVCNVIRLHSAVPGSLTVLCSMNTHSSYYFYFIIFISHLSVVHSGVN